MLIICRSKKRTLFFVRLVELNRFNFVLQALDRLTGDLDEVELRSRKELAVKFESLIVSSELAKTNYLISRVDKTELHQEKAILYGKVCCGRQSTPILHQ